MYKIDLTSIKEKNIYPLSDKFRGKNPSGEEVGFTNYYMTVDGQPYFGVSGELHFSRVSEHTWRDELIKLKMGGINVIATYVFWIHHEEEEGVFRFDGRRNLRKFVEICGELDIKVIVRIGPFDHGEVRNGGIPDWMYGKPFEVRSLNDGFLHHVVKLFNRLNDELEGLYYKDGGPIIAAQMDNEYMHSAAPWEITTGVSNEWISHGTEGDAYMLKIKEIAINAGIVVPFYTCTGWGGAITPTEEMLPLWGGYAFWPWIFYSHKGEHPATPEYIYRDVHNNDVKGTYNFEPTYVPESMPYACCEMGGGMMSSYNYRFQLPYESVAAMANIKIASGCNFLGYYMFKGGTNPLGEKTPFLNESQVNKLSYDYQAAVGEFGQIRPSYHQLRVIHTFTQSFFKELADTKTILPQGAESINPEDVETLRYAVRVKDDKGFLFVNNYQDHMELKEKKNEAITLSLSNEEILIDEISLSKGESAILPFNLDVNGKLLKYSTVQPMTKLSYNGTEYYFFAEVEGMKPRYCFENEEVIYVESGRTSSFELKSSNKTVIVTLSKKDSLEAYLVDILGQKTVILSSTAILYNEETVNGNTVADFRIETEEENVYISSFPECKLNVEQFNEVSTIENDIFKGIKARKIFEDRLKLESVQVGPTRFVIDIPQEVFEGNKEVLLEIDYIGDIGHAFIDGVMISDNFYNGATWDIGLLEQKDKLKSHPICIYITPLKEGVNVNVESVMAGRIEEVEKSTGNITNLGIRVRKEIKL